MAGGECFHQSPFLSAGVGGVAFKTGHYAERLLAEGLDVAKVEATVADEIAALGDSLSPGAPFWGRLTIDGVLVEYRAFPLPGGGVNVGTVFPVGW